MWRVGLGLDGIARVFGQNPKLTATMPEVIRFTKMLDEIIIPRKRVELTWMR
jgi:hypothetical protein